MARVHDGGAGRGDIGTAIDRNVEARGRASTFRDEGTPAIFDHDKVHPGHAAHDTP